MTRRPAREFTEVEAQLALAMLDDGASYRETARTLDRHASTLTRRFPGRGWSATDGGSFGRMVRSAKASQTGVIA